jgi:hypothetical protein
VGAGLGALLEHDDRSLRRELLEPDRGGQARRSGADHDDVVGHRLARAVLRQQFFGRHRGASSVDRLRVLSRSF